MNIPTKCLYLGGLLLVLTGCAGSGQTVALDVKAVPTTKAINQRLQEVTVAVEPFEDLRPDKAKLGVRTHIWGGETVFNVPGGKVSEVMAQVVADYLKHMGFQAWVRRPGEKEPTGDPDIKVTGQIPQLSVHAKSRFFSTVITAKAKAVIQAVNADDRSTVRLNLDGSREDTVFWFEPSEVQEVLNRMLKDNMEKLLADTKVVDHSLTTK